MTITSITLQAATDGSLADLCVANGLLIPGEGAPSLAPGVLKSHIGGATLADGTVLAGRYALISIDSDKFGAAETATVISALQPHTYTGPALRLFFGVAPYDANNTVPYSVTMRQARRALLAVGKLAMVDAAIASLPSPMKEAAQIDWEFSNEVQRHNGLVSQMGPALGMTEAQIDALFIAPAKLA